MKKIIVLVLVLLITASSAACNDNSTTDGTDNLPLNNPFSEENNNENSITNAEFSFGTSVQQLEYTGSALEFEYELENGSVSCEIGIMITIDGVPQKYHTNKNAVDLYLHNFNLGENQNEEFTIIIQPTVGKQGETLLLNTLSVLNPSFQPELTNVEYGNNLKISESGYIPINFKKDVVNAERITVKKAEIVTEIPNEIIEEIALAGGDISNGTDPYLYFDDIKYIEKRKIILDSSNNLGFSINSFGGIENEYKVFIFNDHDVLSMLDYTDCVEMNFLSDKLTTIYVEIDKNAIKEKSSLYAIAFPVIKSIDVAYMGVHPVQTPVYFVE